jgi:hypothetical protein
MGNLGTSLSLALGALLFAPRSIAITAIRPRVSEGHAGVFHAYSLELRESL